MKMSKVKIASLLICAASAVGCVSATVSDDNSCDVEMVDFGTLPALPANVLASVNFAATLPPQTVSFDFSDTINKLDSVASNLQVTINQLVLQSTGDGGNDLAWVRNVDVQITGSASDGSTPMMEMGSADSSLQVKVKMSDTQLLHYLSSGKVTLSITLSGAVNVATIPHGDLKNAINFCVAVSGDFSKSI
jgi:hypothetical protein